MAHKPAGNHAPVNLSREDWYDYDATAASRVIDIEGRSVSGKTSLLTLLMLHRNAEDQKDLPVSSCPSAPGSPLILDACCYL
ncbi:hypothetical protein [Yokenella regensburgei]|uniref:hypothetical protein n=1 Tax=Yokenella regensburgei TaxID=158877 RepID=UPI00137584CA|nr:hypothetical protein [Yokenella regensburgei]KAF1366303.1 hypothetical protein FHR25_005229 [Yokenella regensburgei]